jgi:TonB family protein
MPTEADMARQAEARRQAFDGPDPIQRVEPVYPPLAQEARIEGTVRVQVLIGTDGSVEQVEPISGHPMLAAAVIAAVKQWRYAPQKLETLVQVDVPVKALSHGSARNPQ